MSDDETTAAEAVEEEEEEERIPDMFKGPVLEDPWHRWAPGEEPIREIAVRSIDGDASPNYLLRWAVVEVEPGVLPITQFDRDAGESWDLRFIGRWNATWTGNRLTELSLDCFSEEWPEVVRIILDPTDPVDLLAAYNGSYPGMWSVKLVAEGNPTENARGEIYGHNVSARDPRLALRIAARYPGIALHTDYFEYEAAHETEITSEKGLEIKQEIEEAIRANASEPMPGLAAAMGETGPMMGVAAITGRDAEPPPVPFVEPVSASLDTYTMVGTCALDRLHKATLVRVPAEIIGGLTVHLTFPDAIEAIRRTDPDRLPIWLDFSSDDSDPERRSYPADLTQPLFGVLIDHEDDEEEGGPFHAIIPVGRNVGMREEATALCALAVGPDDAWRFPIPEGAISLITAHRGGVAVRHANTKHNMIGITPEITDKEIGREIAGNVARTTEWVLARVGAVLGAIEDGALHLKRLPEGQRSFELIRGPEPAAGPRRNATLEAARVVANLRELGSLRRVAELEGTEILAVRDALDKAGIDPDQVRRDEVLLRYRRSPSIEGIVAGLHMFRDEVERILREAGIDLGGTPIPHDVTDPKTLEAVATYREEGTLDGAGARLGVSGETIRRRLRAAGLTPDQIDTEGRQKTISVTVEAWENNGRSLAAAARELDVDPRTVKARLVEAGVSIGGTEAERIAEARRLHEIVGSVRAVAALLGVSVSTVRRDLGETGDADNAPGRPRISDGALDQARLAYAEHGSIRAAARAIGMSPGGFAYRLRLAAERDGTR
jgi:hypothetical protein